MTKDLLWDEKTDSNRGKVIDYVEMLQKGEIGFSDVPEEIHNSFLIVKTERKLGIRKLEKKGFDAVRGVFFVEETALDIRYPKREGEQSVKKEIQIHNSFTEFSAYYDFLEGDIYENACYFDYTFSQVEKDTYRIEMNRICFNSLMDKTIRDYTAIMSSEELEQYEAVENEKLLRKKWIDKFNTCNTYNEFVKVVKKYKKSSFYKGTEKELFFYIRSFINSDKEKAFDIIMKLISENGYLDDMKWELLLIYEPQRVVSSYDYKFGVKATINKHKKAFYEFAKQIENGEIRYVRKSSFDEDTHYYCVDTIGYDDEFYPLPVVSTRKVFETFHEMVEYLEGDLSDCDLSRALLPDVDFTKYKINEYTKLPIQNPDDLKYLLYKGYNRIKDLFIVEQRWLGPEDQVIKEYKKEFRYFFDFLHFLENDLSNADLLFCDGLEKLHCLEGINLTGAKLRSNVLDIIGAEYQLTTLDLSSVESFPSSILEEKASLSFFTEQREIYLEEESINNEKVYYISDLHLLHRLKNAFWKTENDIQYIIQRVIDNMLEDMKGSLLLIGGDTSSNYIVFEMFVRLLKHSMEERKWRLEVIFLLGNHEFWDFPGLSIEEIVDKYKSIIEEQNMYLLQNNMLYVEDRKSAQDYRGLQEITSRDLLAMPKEQIREKLRKARIILFGGIAFSGCNDKFNANSGIYRGVINREEEITFSKDFEKLYETVCDIVPDRKVIIFTHTPWKDWCSHSNMQQEYVYVSGHTHRNYFYDDGVFRIYADNQIGYGCNYPGLKYFYIDRRYDIFQDYEDGIYEITKEQYIDFYRGKNMYMTLNRKIRHLYMLKKKGYYSFIEKLKYGELAMLNGGKPKGLGRDDINYFYDIMYEVIIYIKDPLDKFYSLQKEIAKEVRAIGGSGNIHGAIIDIDYWNHIYVNPVDLSVTGYWAEDMVYKEVFPSIPKLLETKCPLLYTNYLKRLEGESKSVFPVESKKKDKRQKAKSQIYLNTDIYEASRIIKKMQKLFTGVLCIWEEPKLSSAHKLPE